MTYRSYVTLSQRTKDVMIRVKQKYQTVLPRVQEALLTSRSKVEILKMSSARIERDFEKAREELKESETKLQLIKNDLQNLYTLRANEYLKPRNEQNIKGINEEENRLNELEKEALEYVTICKTKEEKLFSSFRSSNEALYQTSQAYANKFIILGISIGTVFLTWRSYQHIKTQGVDIGTNNKLLNSGISYNLTQADSTALNNIASSQETTLEKIEESLATLKLIQEQGKDFTDSLEKTTTDGFRTILQEIKSGTHSESIDRDSSLLTGSDSLSSFEFKTILLAGIVGCSIIAVLMQTR